MMKRFSGNVGGGGGEGGGGVSFGREVDFWPIILHYFKELKHLVIIKYIDFSTSLTV